MATLRQQQRLLPPEHQSVFNPVRNKP